jgi:hypothetical protein
MPILTILPENICRVARLNAADEQAFSDALGVIEEEQAALEATLRSDALADPDLEPLLTLLVSKWLAAETLALRARQPGATGTFQGAGLTVSREPDHAATLRAEADKGLLPYRRRNASGVITPAADSPASQTAQARRWGGSG